MKLYVDNARPAPKGWTLAKSVDEAKAILKQHHVEKMSLDYDLDHGANSMPLVEWMRDTGKWPRYAPSVHSGNPEGGQQLKAFIAAHAHRPAPPRGHRAKLKGRHDHY